MVSGCRAGGLRVACGWWQQGDERGVVEEHLSLVPMRYGNCGWLAAGLTQGRKTQQTGAAAGGVLVVNARLRDDFPSANDGAIGLGVTRSSAAA